MHLSLPAHIQRLIEERVRSGKYETAEDVVAAAVEHLDQQEEAGDFEPGEWDALIEEGWRSGAPLDAEAVFQELRQLRNRYHGKAP